MYLQGFLARLWWRIVHKNQEIHATTKFAWQNCSILSDRNPNLDFLYHIFLVFNANFSVFIYL
ncbi:MAG TPA: hypothetical protein VK203_16095 [Nostocaceae cyanobacterium]|nr:hypothetical protein [Nostocaceae cyanobacterium]